MAAFGEGLNQFEILGGLRLQSREKRQLRRPHGEHRANDGHQHADGGHDEQHPFETAVEHAEHDGHTTPAEGEDRTQKCHDRADQPHDDGPAGLGHFDACEGRIIEQVAPDQRRMSERR
ncbi:hypothetical protein NS331_12245 [Pseudacidovorax intermedius]|uniref:Uncharacterized protein n=1 Tax=Pseudacidovorax intermedius TaxID=433924 RepID=A0A147GV45_9BURK|nr:hypothetical protein NS331_12245 [Pseudacidovorax intermedius]